MATPPGAPLIRPAPDARQRALVRASWAAAAPMARALVLAMFDRLFERDPTLVPLFERDLGAHAGRVVGMLDRVLSGLDRPDTLLTPLAELGARHQGYGMKPAHLGLLAAAWLDTLSCALAPGFDAERRAAWAATLQWLAQAMTRPAAGVLDLSSSQHPADHASA